MTDKVSFIIDWLEQSKLPPVTAALMIMIFSIWRIWREFKYNVLINKGGIIHTSVIEIIFNEGN